MQDDRFDCGWLTCYVASVFGVGSLIHSGLELGAFVEVFTLQSDERMCNNMDVVIRPFLQMTFVFVQTYFIFLNQKV
jgi:hypothetical protein